MKVTPRFMLRAGLVITAAGVIGAFGACKSDNTTTTPPPPPPPPLAAPTNLAATAVGTNKINLTWDYTDTTVTGFRLDRCSGASCANFTSLAANIAKAMRAYSDTGLAVNTSYSYRIRAFRGSDTSAWSGTVNATTGTGGSASFTMVAAGEISQLGSAGPSATATIVNNILKADPNAFAVTIGDNVTDPSVTKFAGTTFDATWGLASTGIGGSFSDRASYAIGNGDFSTNRPASEVYGYFGSHTGPADKGWFSFDKGSWHIVVLNTADWQRGAGSTFGNHFDGTKMVQDTSSQVDWLTNDLSTARTNGAKCIAIISWERRFYTTGKDSLGRQANMLRMSQLMYANRVDVLISAKDKLYERFAPMEPNNGTADANGFRQFIVGTGGRSADQMPTGGAVPTREVGFALPASEWGVLKLTLGDGNYGYEFVNTNPASTNVDKSTAPVACHS